jgi:hypothetical protein
VNNVSAMFKSSCHVVPPLRLLVSSSPQAHCHFFFRSVGVELPEVASAPTAPARRLSVVCSFVWAGAGPSTVPCRSFTWVWLLGTWPAAQGRAWGPPRCRCTRIFMSVSCTPSANALPVSYLTWSSDSQIQVNKRLLCELVYLSWKSDWLRVWFDSQQG